jgi:hypothetical protein
MEAKMEENIGIVLCTCAGSFCSRAEAEEIAARLRYGGVPSESVHIQTALCGGADFKNAADRIRKKNYGKILFAGCSPARRDPVVEGLADTVGIPRGAVMTADIWRAGKGPFVDRAALKLVKTRKALAGVSLPAAPATSGRSSIRERARGPKRPVGRCSLPAAKVRRRRS